MVDERPDVTTVPIKDDGRTNKIHLTYLTSVSTGGILSRESL